MTPVLQEMYSWIFILRGLIGVCAAIAWLSRVSLYPTTRETDISLVRNYLMRIEYLRVFVKLTRFLLKPRFGFMFFVCSKRAVFVFRANVPIGISLHALIHYLYKSTGYYGAYVFLEKILLDALITTTIIARFFGVHCF